MVNGNIIGTPSPIYIGMKPHIWDHGMGVVLNMRGDGITLTMSMEQLTSLNGNISDLKRSSAESGEIEGKYSALLWMGQRNPAPPKGWLKPYR